MRYLLPALLLFVVTFTALPLAAQQRMAAVPPSFEVSVAPAATVVVPAPAPDLVAFSPAPLSGSVLGAARHGVEAGINLGLDNAGQWTTLPDGGRLWRLRLEAPGAQSINLLYDDFFLPDGAQLFLYTDSRRHVLGPFTVAHNLLHGGFATDLLPGEATTLEYYEPAGVAASARLRVASLIYGFRALPGTAAKQQGNPYAPSALACSITAGSQAAVTSEAPCDAGAGWEAEASAVVRIVQGGNTCSGVLLNNAAQDETLYVLTAHHCQTPNVGDVVDWVFQFNYESSTCADPAEYPIPPSITGATVVAAEDMTHNADFTLLRLDGPLSEEANLLLAGWSIEDVVPPRTTVLAHPRGDIKKITFDDDAPWQYLDYHWISTFDRGTIEIGSSGGPLFDQARRVIGFTSYGYTLNHTTCSGGDDNEAMVGFPRLAYIWDRGAAGERISDFLDPHNTGITSLGSLQPLCPGCELPVELTRFDVQLDGTTALLAWATASETNNAGFYVEIDHGTTGSFAQLDFVDGHGTTDLPQRYAYRAERLEPGRHTFRLKQVDYDGAFEYSPEVEVFVEMPERFVVEPAYPNPFNPEATLRFAVSRAQHVEVALYDMMGRRVLDLYAGEPATGAMHVVRIDGSRLPSGMYLVRVVGDAFQETQTVTLAR